MQGVTWVAHDKEELVDMLGRWIIAYPKTLKCHLTYEADLEADLKVGFTLGSCTTVMATVKPPLVLLANGG